jgi:CRP-like cAMP-binding protein
MTFEHKHETFSNPAAIMIILQVEVLSDDSDTASEVLTEGSSFGLESLLFNTPMERSARAVSHVDMFTVSYADFQRVLKDHPSIADSIAELAVKEYGKRVSL